MLIQLQNISKHYENPQTGNKHEVLKDITLTVEKGESIAIVGPSGCGKSTLLNIIGALDKPSDGSANINGSDINSLRDSDLSILRNKDIGFVFQMHHLLDQLTLLENVLLPTVPLKDKELKDSASERAMELLKSVGLEGKTHQRPGQLSGGECQRTAVVRALINQPKLLLADEPTGSLDGESAKQLGDILIKLNKEHELALIVVTHSLELAERMGKVYELIDGKLIGK
jgi:lipoprotein-releasing system ATP-binding protein